MKIKSKYTFTLLSTLMAIFAVSILASGNVFAESASGDAVITVVPACTFTTSTATTTIPTASGVVSNSESISAKPDIVTTCNGLNGWKIQAIGFSPDSTHPDGNDGNTSMYASGGTIATGTSGSDSYWSMKISSLTSNTTTATILNGYGSYSSVPNSAVNVANIAGDGAGGSVTGTMRADYQIFVSGSQAPGTYTGIVKYTIAVNP